MGRRIFVGDIQGCREELEALLEAARFDPSADRLMPLGDLVGRGPDALGTLRLLVGLGAEPVLGNHDLHTLRAAAGVRRPRPSDRIDGLLAADDCDELMDWLRAQPFLRLEPDYLLVHAGLHPLWSNPEVRLALADPVSEHPHSTFATRVRYCSPTGERPDGDESVAPPPPFAPWYSFYDPAQHGGRRAVFGHWSQRGLVDEPQALGLDTGCVWGRELTAWIPEERRFVAVRARRAHASPTGD